MHQAKGSPIGSLVRPPQGSPTSEIRGELEKKKPAVEITGKFFEKLYWSKIIQSDPLKHVILFPTQDVQVKALPPSRTSVLSVPEEATQKDEGEAPNGSRMVDLCVEFCTAEKKFLVFACREQHGKGAIHPTTKTSLSSTPLVFEVLRKEDMPQEVILDTDILKFNAEVQKQDTQNRQQNRNCLFDLYPTSHADLQESDTRVYPPLPAEQMGIPILVECSELRLALGEKEPLWCSFALYRRDTKEKISETFHFDLNTEKLRDMAVGRTEGQPGEASKAQKALFFVRERHPEIYLVLRVEKVFTGDIKDGLEPYFKHASFKPKALSKFSKDLETACEALGKWSQPFGWAAYPLFNETGSLRVGVDSDAFQSLLKMSSDISDDVMCDKLAGFVSDKEKKKMKGIPIKMQVTAHELKSVEDIPARRFTSRLIPAEASGGNDIVREVLPFAMKEEIQSQPYYSYVNELYIYPISVNLSNYSNGKIQARNIVIHVKYLPNDFNPATKGLSVFYGKSWSPNMSDEAITSCTYHNKKPTFFDEIKMRLPHAPTPTSNLLFSFYHVDPKTKKKKKEKAKSPNTFLGYAVLPIFEEHGDLLKDERRVIDVALDLPSSYLDTTNDGLEIKYVDKKPVFTVATRLVSSVYSQHPVVSSFMRSYDKETEAQHLIEEIDGLKKLSSKEIGRYYLIIMNALFRLIESKTAEVAVHAFRALVHIIRCVDGLPKEGHSTHHPLLTSYVTYFFGNPPPSPSSKDSFAEKLVKLWIIALLESSKVSAEEVDNVNSHAWFLFEIITKSMALALHAANRLEKDSDRSDRIGESFLVDARHLLTELSKHVLRGGIPRGKDLNIAVAYFIKDLFSITDRGFVLDLAYLYLTGLNNGGVANRTFNSTFLRIVADHEHYVQLNLPIPDKIDSISQLVERLWQKHFLVGLLLHEVALSREDKDKGSRLMAAMTIKNLLMKHEFDERYQEPKVKERIAGIYFPFILMMVDGRLSHFSPNDREEKEVMFLCFLHILSRSNRHLLQQWWGKETQGHVKRFFELLVEGLELFQYDPLGLQKARQKEQEAIERMKESLHASEAQGKNAARKKGKGAKGKSTLLAQSAPPEIGAAEPSSQRQSVLFKEEFSEKAAHVSLEVSLIVLDLLLGFMIDNESDLNSDNTAYMEDAFSVMVTLLRMNQSDSFLLHMFRALRSVINIFSKMLFTHNKRAHTTNCGQLTYEILRHCNFNNPTVRSAATALIYLMIRKNWQERGNFQRMKLLLTVAVERMVQSNLGKEDTHLSRSLDALAQFTSTDNMPSPFGNEIRELVKRLQGAQKNQARMAAYRYDPEMMAELFLETSNGYTDSPDLRVTWLAQLADYHKRQDNLEEAAQCKIQLCGVVCVYLTLLKSADAIAGSHMGAFRNAAPTIGSQLTVPHIEANEGMCTIEQFTRSGLYKELLEAIELLKKRELYETCIEVYRLLTSIHQSARDYVQLVQCYADLESLCHRIVAANETGSRLFAKYYRVGLYGNAFGESNGKEYIYKEHAAVRMGDISERLRLQYGSKFGVEKIVLLPNKPIDPSTFEEGKLYIQVVETMEYLEPQEEEKRITPFERVFNLNRFVFETPFVMPGKKMGDMEDQYKRKTILTTAQPFPSMTKRQLILKKEEIVLTPIETSIDLIRGRVHALQHEANSPFPNTKTLQIVLQGSVLLQVNAGPLEICRIFLGETASKYPAEHVASLRKLMAQFLEAAGAALATNNRLIKADQLPFQEKLEEGYKDAQIKIGAYLESQPAPKPAED